jgi:hypothetical protein
MGVMYVRNIDDKVLLEFKAFVVAKHGKLHGALGIEVTEALKQYLESKRSTHTQVRQVPPKIQKELPLLKKAIYTYVDKGGSIPETMLANIIRQTSKVIDYRSIKNRIEALVSVKFLSKDWMASPDGKIYRVVGDATGNS